MDRGGEGASNGDVFGGAELVVVVSEERPAGTTAGQSDGRELRKERERRKNEESEGESRD